MIFECGKTTFPDLSFFYCFFTDLDYHTFDVPLSSRFNEFMVDFYIQRVNHSPTGF